MSRVATKRPVRSESGKDSLMNKREYAEYEVSVKDGLRGLEAVSSGACKECAQCCATYIWHGEPKGWEYEPEPGFSRGYCDVCGSSLAGDRYPVHGVLPGNKHDEERILHMEACDDCVHYLEYGQLNDTAMEEIEESN